ncbi:hypothetical protein QFZ36_001906 [Pseudarthrobacter siccitolerans]|uniref:Uncharacterized protein n=1 Tax=Pseudarthrobacter siccitolerans TaxID=861266 RepID=A0ABU0PK74_9MICC|nr:hypothetical protein [Pseudarthrobacter siccitolerans]
MPEPIIRSQGTRPFRSFCCATHRMCAMRSALQRQLPRC